MKRLELYSVVWQDEVMSAVADKPLSAAKIALQVWRERGIVDPKHFIGLIEINRCAIPESVGIKGGQVFCGGGAIVPMEPTFCYQLTAGRLCRYS